jgi:hypothetical protein
MLLGGLEAIFGLEPEEQPDIARRRERPPIIVTVRSELTYLIHTSDLAVGMISQNQV